VRQLVLLKQKIISIVRMTGRQEVRCVYVCVQTANFCYFKYTYIKRWTSESQTLAHTRARSCFKNVWVVLTVLFANCYFNIVHSAEHVIKQENIETWFYRSKFANIYIYATVPHSVILGIAQYLLEHTVLMLLNTVSIKTVIHLLTMYLRGRRNLQHILNQTYNQLVHFTLQEAIIDLRYFQWLH
jgi:hypothetical protein